MVYPERRVEGLTIYQKEFKLKEKMGKIIFKNKIFLGIFLAVLVLCTLATSARAAFIEDAGVGGGTADPTNTFWNKAAQSVNSTEIDAISWTGWPFYSIMFHAEAAMRGYPQADGTIPIVAYEKSLLGRVNSLSSAMYQEKPISSVNYLAYLKNNFGLGIKPVYAQGEGWKFLVNPFMALWQIMRNISYLAFVMIFIGLGFMIMFRKKIDPQTVMGIQSAIPKIIVSLLLITFSYAIAGFLIDLAFLGNKMMNLAILDQAPINDFLAATGTTTQKGLPCDPSAPALPSTHGPPRPCTYNQTYKIRDVNPFDLINYFLLDAPGGFAALLNQNIMSGLIFTIVVLTAAFKIFLALLSRFVTIVISTIFAPLTFLWGSFPGQEEHISKWFRTLLAAVLTFPAMYLLLNLAAYFLLAGRAYFINIQGIDPLKLSIFGIGMGGGNLPVVGGHLLAIGIILMAPSLPSIIDDALAVKPSTATEGIGAGIGGALRRVPGIGSLIG